jgi:hypothetical protein
LNENVEPSSLWTAQLEQRLGKKPTWIQSAEVEWAKLLASWKEVPLSDLLVAEKIIKPEQSETSSENAKTRYPQATQIWEGPWTFNGTSAGAKTISDFPTLPGQFSIALHVKMASRSDIYQNLLMREKNGQRDVGIFAKGNLKWGVSYTGESKVSSEESKARIDDDRWHQLFLVFDGTKKEARFHIDGKCAAKWTTRGESLTEIGGALTLGSGLVGGIDYVVFWDRALSEEEANKESVL